MKSFRVKIRGIKQPKVMKAWNVGHIQELVQQFDVQWIKRVIYV